MSEGRGGISGMTHLEWEAVQRKIKKRKRQNVGLVRPTQRTLSPYETARNFQTQMRPTVQDPSDYYDQNTSLGRGLTALDQPGIGSPFVEGGPEPSEAFIKTAQEVGTPLVPLTYQAIQKDRQIEDLRAAFRKVSGGKDPSPVMVSRLLKVLPEVTQIQGAPGDSEQRQKLYESILKPVAPSIVGSEQLSGFRNGEYDYKSMAGAGMSLSFAPARGDPTWGTDESPQATGSMLPYLRSDKYQSEALDRDVSRNDKLRHIAMTSDVLYLKQEIAQREKEAFEGLVEWEGVDFDPNSAEWDGASDRAYRRYLFNGQPIHNFVFSNFALMARTILR